MIERERVGPVEKFRLARNFRGLFAYHTAAYRVGELLIDSGPAHTVAELLDAIERGGPIVRVANTHSHEDHIAGNGPLQARYGAEVLAHPLALPILADPRGQMPLQLYRRVFWGTPAPSRGRPIGEVLETGRYRLQVIPTPGHAPDHVSLFEPSEGWLFAGDAFVGGRDRMLRADSDVWQIITSLRRLKDLDAGVLFPGSGTIYPKPQRVFEQKIAYLEEQGSRVLGLARLGFGPREIQRQLFGREDPIAWFTEGDFDSLSLVRSYLDCASSNRSVP